MKNLGVTYDRNVIVGMDTSDDAGVYRLDEETALIQTVDFFTPIVDDPYTYGRIAVANGLSDVYAMGGRPLTALNIVCFPTKKFSLNTLDRILKGGLDTLKQAGVQLLGGHSVEDDELKFGVAVTGLVHPDKVLRNSGLRDGDRIILTKALGTGIIGTAVKAGAAEEGVMGPFVKSMTDLNGTAAAAMRDCPVRACTDVTGFGLMGHLSEMLAGDGLRVVVDAAALPILPGAVENAALGLIPAGMYRNRDFTASLCSVDASVKREIADIAFDPQTSGGLLICCPTARASELIGWAKAELATACGIVGRVVEAAGRPLITVHRRAQVPAWAEGKLAP
jgi:selenide,water dikinase